MSLTVDTSDVLDIKNKINKTDPKQTTQLLKVLETLGEFQITRELLEKSQIHLLLSKIAKNKKQEYEKTIVEKATAIRISWKKVLLKSETTKKDFGKSEDEQENELFAMDRFPVVPVEPEIPLEEPTFEDPLRKMVYDQIKSKLTGHTASKSQLVSLSRDIEELLSLATGNDQTGYKRQAKQKILVLADKTHGKEIIDNLLSGKLSVQELVSKEVRDLFSNASLHLIEETAKNQSMLAMQADYYRKNLKIGISEFTCRKCKSSKVFSEQKQTRSADEPMTTFLTCQECNNKWKQN